MRIFIPLIFVAAFLLWALYQLLIKKELRKQMNVVYMAMFFFGVWAILYFVLFK